MLNPYNKLYESIDYATPARRYLLRPPQCNNNCVLLPSVSATTTDATSCTDNLIAGSAGRVNTDSVTILNGHDSSRYDRKHLTSPIEHHEFSCSEAIQPVIEFQNVYLGTNVDRSSVIFSETIPTDELWGKFYPQSVYGSATTPPITRRLCSSPFAASSHKTYSSVGGPCTALRRPITRRVCFPTLAAFSLQIMFYIKFYFYSKIIFCKN